MLVVQYQIKISSDTRCSHRFVMFMPQLTITKFLVSRTCNNLMVSGTTSSSPRATPPPAMFLSQQVVMQGSQMTRRMMICTHDESY